MMKLHAKGMARHRFWGEYSAHIVLQFDSMPEAIRALPMLNDGIDFGNFLSAGGGYRKSEVWRHIKDSEGDAFKALFLEVAEPALTLVTERLVKYGADPKKILSMAKSIDYGEEFEIEMEAEDPDQMKLL